MTFQHPFKGNMTLREAQDVLRPLTTDGHKCPLCTQFAKVYKRKIHAGMVRTLIAMYRKGGLGWVYLPDVKQKSRDSTGMAWWDLIEEEKALRPDGGRVGWWRLTSLGEEFVLDRRTVRKYAHIYDGRWLSFSGDMVGIRDCLGTQFNYEELMAGA